VAKFLISFLSFLEAEFMFFPGFPSGKVCGNVFPNAKAWGKGCIQGVVCVKV